MLQFTKQAPTEYWNGFVAHAAVRLVAEVGWSAKLIGTALGRLDIDCDGTQLVFRNFGLPAGFEPADDVSIRSETDFAVMSPPRIALEAFGDVFGCTSGTATVIAPVGRYGSHVEAGMIDAVTVPVNGIANRGRDWPMDVVTVGHSRCWVVAATVFPERRHDAGDVVVALRRSKAVAYPPPTVAFQDTAQLCEAMLDEGWPSGLFPRPLMMASHVEDGGTSVRGWIAATEAATIVSIAQAIGSTVAGTGSADDRRELLEEAWKTTGHCL